MAVFKLDHIEDVKYRINKEYNYDIFNIENIITNLKNSMSISNNKLEFQISVTFVDENSTELLFQSLKYIFIGDFKDCILLEDKKNDEKKKKLKSLMINITNIALGGLRGVVFAKTVNHPIFSKFPIPLIGADNIEDSINRMIERKK